MGEAFGPETAQPGPLSSPSSEYGDEYISEDELAETYRLLLTQWKESWFR